MKVRVRSHVPRMFQLRSAFVMIGRLTPTSHVWLASVPAFCHCVLKPSDDGVFTGRIWSLVTPSACVISTPRRLKSVKSPPNSVSVVVSGLRSLLPAWPSEQPLTPQLYVSYCAVKRGVEPADPREARRR